MEYDINWGPYLKLYRKRKKYTQSKVASDLNMSLRQYAKYESGSVVPPIDKVVTLARVLGFTLTITPSMTEPVSFTSSYEGGRIT